MRNNPPYFGVEIQTAGFIPHQLLFAERTEEALENAGFSGSHIYYLTRTPKLRFIPSSASLSDEYDLNIHIEVGGNKIVSTSVPLASLPPFCDVPVDALGSIELEVDVKNSTSSEFMIKGVTDGKKYSIPIPLITFLANQEFDFGFKPEIIYIGQSFNMLNRWRNHKRVNHGLSILSDNEELRLYFIHFRFFASFNDFGDTRWNNFLDMSDRSTQQFKDRISILEQALIQFYRPQLNEQLVDGQTNTTAYKRIVSATGIKGVAMSIGMHGNDFQFWSSKQHLPSETITLVDEDGNPTFKDGLMIKEFTMDQD